MNEQANIRIHGNRSLPTLIYLPGLHGDWTLISQFRKACENEVCLVEVTYPQTLSWSIKDYAAAIEAELLGAGITHGWLLGESFGSQVAWALLEKSQSATKNAKEIDFTAAGLILAAGFVKHPWHWGPSLLRMIGKLIPNFLWRGLLKLFAVLNKIRLCNHLDGMKSLDEFVARRTELDRRAMSYRLKLIDQYDARAVAKNLTVPVYYLAGLVDPLVPWPVICRWLRANCPTYRDRKVILFANHNVLTSAPQKSAQHILGWMKANQISAPASKRA